MLTGIMAGLAAGALWGLVFIAPHMTPGLSSVDLTAGRFLSYGGMATLIMAVTWRSHKWPTPRQALAALGLSLIGITGYYLLLVLAIQGAGTEVPALIVGTIPIWVTLLGKPRRLTWSALLPGLGLTTVGLALMMKATSPVAPALTGSGGFDFWWGVALAVLATVGWTAFAILNAAWLKRHPEINATEWANWLGIATGMGAVGLWLVLGSDLQELAALENIPFLAAVCIVTGIGAGWGGSVLWNIASQRLSPSLCGQLIVSETVFALLYSFLWDGSWPSTLQWLAAVLFVLGILASIRAHQ